MNISLNLLKQSTLNLKDQKFSISTPQIILIVTAIAVGILASLYLLYSYYSERKKKLNLLAVSNTNDDHPNAQLSKKQIETVSQSSNNPIKVEKTQNIVPGSSGIATGTIPSESVSIISVLPISQPIDDKIVIQCENPKVKEEVEHLLKRSFIVKPLGKGELYISKIDQVQRKNICFLLKTMGDEEWLKRDLQKYARRDVDMHFAVSLDKFKGDRETTLFFKIHDVTNGRLAPDQLDDEMMDLVIEGARNVVITVLVGENAKGVNLTLTSIIRSGIGLVVGGEQDMNERVVNCWRIGLKQLCDPKQAWNDIMKCLDKLENA